MYGHLAATGETASRLDTMLTRAELYETVGYHEFESLDQSIASSVVPPTPKT